MPKLTSRRTRVAEQGSSSRAHRGGTSALQRLADASPAVAQLRALRDLAAPLQREGLEEEDLQMKADPLQREGLDEEDLQMKADPSASASRSSGGASGGLPTQLRDGVESLSGMSMGDVRVHRNSAAPARVGAHAYAQGSDIHVAPGQDRHIPHEAWHVVQQRQGRVNPTTSVNGAAVNDDPSLEAEADRMGARAMQTAQRRERDA